MFFRTTIEFCIVLGHVTSPFFLEYGLRLGLATVLGADTRRNRHSHWWVCQPRNLRAIAHCSQGLAGALAPSWMANIPLESCAPEPRSPLRSPLKAVAVVSELGAIDFVHGITTRFKCFSISWSLIGDLSCCHLSLPLCVNGGVMFALIYIREN